jgi:hypothetical protein
MVPRWTLAVAFALVASVSWAAPQSGGSQFTGDWQGYGDLQFRIADEKSDAKGGLNAGGEIQVRLTKKPATQVVLMRFERRATVVVSLDEKWLAVNDQLASNTFAVRLFYRSGGLDFHEKTTPDVNDIAWRFLRDSERVPFPTGPGWSGVLGHNYIEVLTFSADSRAVLLKLWGHEDKDAFLYDWLCVVDLVTGKASSDLSVMNRGAVHFKR